MNKRFSYQSHNFELHQKISVYLLTIQMSKLTALENILIVCSKYKGQKFFSANVMSQILRSVSNLNIRWQPLAKSNGLWFLRKKSRMIVN